ncbi:hypothetical protein SISSUDRAFT_74083 [Sistotremastrum suecicum HHB10207 ss-3]|uniref:Uncharacterized protein n=1 Tax=Sistotremastrum suecicum HHB10207 ss-3 TaxID=1314776 RepID=A0A166BGN0_9AGAM|nr:hypothetical protein SISSUDRAFT_74083 [Sistotremastrum suecicum HHB10207 ss-3]
MAVLCPPLSVLGMLCPSASQIFGSTSSGTMCSRIAMRIAYHLTLEIFALSKSDYMGIILWHLIWTKRHGSILGVHIDNQSATCQRWLTGNLVWCHLGFGFGMLHWRLHSKSPRTPPKTMEYCQRFFDFCYTPSSARYCFPLTLSCIAQFSFGFRVACESRIFVVAFVDCATAYDRTNFAPPSRAIG